MDRAINENSQIINKISRSSLLFLVLSIVNIVVFCGIVMPSLMFFYYLWFLSSSNILYFLLVFGTTGYIIASIVAIIASIINIIKKDTILKKCFMAILISFIIGVAFLPIYHVITYGNIYGPIKTQDNNR